MYPLEVFILFFETVLALPTASFTNSTWARTSPSEGAIIVDGSSVPITGSFPTVQSGVNALSLNSTTPQTLFIYSGTYIEQVYIPLLKSNLTVQGYTEDAQSYEGNKATISCNLSRQNISSNDLTATLRQWNTNTKIYNLNIINNFGRATTNGQALAVSAHTGNQGYYGVQLWGYQDTLLTNVGNQVYAKSLIVGAVDFIFGMNATAWFEQLDIRTVGTGWVTANGRTDAASPSWYVINNSTVAGLNSSIAAGSSSLGRPWRSFSRVVFQNTELGDVIPAAGWSVWSSTQALTENVLYGEHNNYGPGSVLETGPRANFSTQLTEPIPVETVLGDGYSSEWWVDMNYLP